MKQKRKPKIWEDHRGEYILRTYFVRGKMKKEKIYVIDGIPAEEFYLQNADPITLLQERNYDILHERGY